MQVVYTANHGSVARGSGSGNLCAWSLRHLRLRSGSHRAIGKLRCRSVHCAAARYCHVCGKRIALAGCSRILADKRQLAEYIVPIVVLEGRGFSPWGNVYCSTNPTSRRVAHIIIFQTKNIRGVVCVSHLKCE
jgi:hypothetical protein